MSDDKDDDLDLTMYYTESEDEGMDMAEWLMNHTQFPIGTKIWYSDDASMDGSEDDQEIDDSFPDVDQNLTMNTTSGSAYEGDISNQVEEMSLPLRSRQKKKSKKNRVAPILRRTYYGRKRLMTGIRHFVSSVIEYSAGAALESSHRKIPFFSLSVSPDKPNKKNKVPNPMQADVICDTGASISLAPISIARKLKMRVDKS